MKPGTSRRRFRLYLTLTSIVLLAGILPATAGAEPPLGGADAATLGREPIITPGSLGDGQIDGLQYPDPTEGLALVSPPEASNEGSAQLSYPLLVPPGRGITPELALSYDSGGGNGWLGVGWDLSVGEISVDTRWGAPHFDPDFESETYLIDGEPLVPNALGDTWEPRLPGDRQDYTRRVEGDYEQIIRRSAGEPGTKNYFWEVHDKEGNVRWYGGHPDVGGPFGGAVQSGGSNLTIDPSAIVYDEAGNAVKWLLSAERDVGVNMIRYHYETIEYSSTPVGWVPPTPPQTTCTPSSTNLCGRHTYLSRIDYTAAAQASGEPEDPAYQVHFLLESDTNPGANIRLDPIVDAIGGYVDVVSERLARVEVRYGAPNGGAARTYDQVAVRYDLDYRDGPFGKSLLDSVTQVGATPADSPQHQFVYYDEVSAPGGGYAGFETTAAAWNTFEDLPKGLLLDPNVSVGALGASESNSGEGHAYIGFNPTIPQKVGSFGGSIQIGGGRTDALSEWIDLNGDSLPDKVFKQGGTIKYRLNQGGPNGSTTFTDPAVPVAGISQLSSESNIGFQVSIEAHLGVTASFGLGGDVTWGDTYFTDINSDGLPDLVAGGQVYFNRLAAGVPTFTNSSGGTPVPIVDTAAPTVAVQQIADIESDLADDNPLVDTVRRWVAPFAGTISIDAMVTLDPPGGASTDGVRVAVQHNGSEVVAANLLTTGSTAFTSPLVRDVSPGDRIYFRVGAVDEGTNDEVLWDPTISYTAIDGVADVSAVPLDVNGLSQTFYSASSDFTLAGRPDTQIVMPFAGTVRFEATVTKASTTTDDVQLVLEHNGVAVPGGPFVVAAGFTGSQTVVRDFSVAAPVQPDDANPNVEPSQDTVHAHLAADSPIDLTVVQFSPTLRYLSGVDRDGAPLVDPETVQVDISPEVEQYPNRNRTTVIEPVRVGAGTYDARLSFNLAGGNVAGGTAVVTIKSASGLVAKQSVTIPGSLLPGSHLATVDLNAALAANTDYWFDVMIRDFDLANTTNLASFTLRPDGATNADNDVTVDATQHWAHPQGIFPLPYRGWAVAGYTANGTLATAPIDEGAFDIDPSQLPTDPDDIHTPSGFDDQSPPGLDPNFESPAPDSAYAYVPVVASVSLPNRPAPLAVPVWRGTQDNLVASADRIRSSRYGSDSASVGIPSGGSSRAVTRVGIAAPTAALAFGIGPLAASFGIGPSFGLVDYEDMNGDGFPDVITPGSVQYTTQRGGFLPTPDSIPDGRLAVTNQDLTMAVTGGISGGLVDIKANTKGKTNAVTGQSAGKGDDANDSSGGVSIGAEVNASWTSPNASGPADTPAIGGGTTDPATTYSSQSGQAPGDSSGATAPIQQALADINGDGLPDRVFTNPSGVFAYYNLGYGFASAPVSLTNGGFESQESYAGAFSAGFSTPWGEFSGGVATNWNFDISRYSWRDVNGDGILDQVHKINNTDPPTVAFGTGSGTLAPVVYGTMASSQATAQIDAGQQVSFDRSTGIGGSFDFTIYIGPLCLVACYLVINPGASYQNSVSSTEVDLTDVDGDGYPDSVSTTNDDTLWVRRNTHGRTNLLKKVTNPLGGTIDLQYERDGNTVDHPDSIWSMSLVEVNDGRPGDGVDSLTTSYDYSGLKFDRLHRDSLGYSTVVAHELNPSGVSIRDTVREYLNDSVFVAGLEKTLEVTDAVTGEMLQGSKWQWGFRDVRNVGSTFDVLAPVNPVPAPALGDLTGVASLGYSIAPLLMRVDEYWGDPNEALNSQSTRMEFTYDGLGNILTQRDYVELDDPNDDLLATFVYSNCDISSSTALGCVSPAPARVSPIWSGQLCPTWVSLPVEFTITNGKSAPNEILYRHRDGRTDICDNASVTYLEETIDSSTVAVTQLAYDEWGSYDRIVYPAGDDGRRYAVQYEYDVDRHSDVAMVSEYDLDDASADEFIATGSVANAVQVGLSSSATFDPLAGRVASRTDANGNVTTYTYDALGRIASISSPRPSDPVPLVTYEYYPTAAGYAHAVAHHYDAFNVGDLIDTVTFVDGTGRVTQTKRDAAIFVAAGQPVVDGRIVSGATNFDALGRAIEQYYPTADTKAQTTYETAVSTGPVTTTEYDLYDLPVRIVEPGSRVTTIDYEYAKRDSAGPTLYRTTVTDPRLRRTITFTDIRELVMAVDDQPDGLAPLRTTYDYDPMGQLVRVVDTAGFETSHTYDLLGRRTATTTPDGGLVEWAFDNEGKLVSEVTPNLRAAGVATGYEYELGKLVKIDYPDGTPDVTYTYGGTGAANNGAGRIIQSDDGSRILTLKYAPSGAVLEETAEMKLHNWDPTDPDGFRWTTEWTYDGLGRIESVVYPDSEVLTYDYDSGGFVSSIVGSEDGIVDVVVGVDINGDPIVVQQPMTWNYEYLRDRQYDLFLRRAYQELGNGVTTEYTYDTDTQWLSRQQTLSPNRNVADPAYQEIQDLNYTYDDVGNPLTYDNALPPPVSSLFGGATSQSYVYDAYDRIVSGTGRWEQATGKLRHYTFAVEYDARGNVISKDQTDDIFNGKKDLEQKKTTYSFDRTYTETAPHQATAVGSDTYHYDLNGNLLGIKDRRDKWIRQITWDATDRMRVVTDGPSTTTYKYDDSGQRTIERGPAGETAFVNPWLTIRNGNEMFKHIWAADERIATQRDDGGYEELKRYFLHKDLQGSTNMVTDYLGEPFQHHEYFPTGQVWVDESSTVFRTPYQYGGGYVDEQRGIISFGARWYDQNRELFYSPDPVLTDDPTAVVDQPALRAAYSYAGSNPLTYVDPTGLRFTKAQATAFIKANAKQARAIIKSDPARRARFVQNVDTRLPRSFVKLALSDRADKLQKFADRFDAKPFIEIDFRKGTAKFSLGIGKRLKIPRNQKGSVDADASTSDAADDNGRPRIGNQRRAAGDTSPQAPPPPGGTNDTGGSGQADTSQGTQSQKPKRPTKPLPKPPTGPADGGANRGDQ